MCAFLSWFSLHFSSCNFLTMNLLGQNKQICLRKCAYLVRVWAQSRARMTSKAHWCSAYFEFCARTHHSAHSRPSGDKYMRSDLSLAGSRAHTQLQCFIIYALNSWIEWNWIGLSSRRNRTNPPPATTHICCLFFSARARSRISHIRWCCVSFSSSCSLPSAFGPFRLRANRSLCALVCCFCRRTTAKTIAMYGQWQQQK